MCQCLFTWLVAESWSYKQASKQNQASGSSVHVALCKPFPKCFILPPFCLRAWPRGKGAAGTVHEQKAQSKDTKLRLICQDKWPSMARTKVGFNFTCRKKECICLRRSFLRCRLMQKHGIDAVAITNGAVRL